MNTTITGYRIGYWLMCIVLDWSYQWCEVEYSIVYQTDWFTFDIEESIELIDVCKECIWRGVKYFDVCNEMIIESIRIVPNEWSIRWLVLNDYWLIHLNEWRMNTFTWCDENYEE